MRIKTIEQNIALKQLKGTMAGQLHPTFSNMYTV